jgi:hypothetical protein
MALTTIISSAQKRVKDAYAGSPTVGLALRSNGEERVKIIDRSGNVWNAEIPIPTVTPTAVAAAGAGLPTGQWAAYVYAYASNKYPFIENAVSINGQLWPRSNQSAFASVQVSGGNLRVNVTVTKTTLALISHIWIFRTTWYSTQAEAETAAAAGQVFFLRQEVNDGIAGTIVYNDANPISSADQIETDNFAAPQFQFCVYYDPYWFGFGNLPFVDTVSWVAATGIVTLTGGATWFDGRNGQIVTLSGVTTGGFDGQGGFIFKWLSSTTAQMTLDGTTTTTIPGANQSNQTITIQGPATTLYRSKPRNPFSWGFTDVIGVVNVPQTYAFKVGGGIGTAIAIVPNTPTLKLDCEFPAKCFTLNLRAAGTSAFEGTLRTISDVYSVTAHSSQFSATTREGNTVLWGIDFKNFAILQSDGITQVPISNNIGRILRGLTKNRSRQLLTHGVYDPQTELNCMWVSTENSLSLIDYVIFQHAPTGFWGFSFEKDILASGSIQDTLTGFTKTFVGTQTGLLGQAFVPGLQSNWIPDTGAFTGLISSATPTSITKIGASFNTSNNGVVGNWCLIVSPQAQMEQWGRVSAVSAQTLTFDWIIPYMGGVTTAFNPVPIPNSVFYLGVTECRLSKSFDFNQPSTDKRLLEMWITQQGIEPSAVGPLIRFYRERATDFFAQFAMSQTGSDAWNATQVIPPDLTKSFTLEIIQRGYLQWRFFNMVMKLNMAP